MPFTVYCSVKSFPVICTYIIPGIGALYVGFIVRTQKLDALLE